METNETVDTTNGVADNTADTNELEVVLDNTTTEPDTEVEDKDKIIQTLSAQKAHFKKKYEELAKKAIEPAEKQVVKEAPRVESSSDVVVARLEARGFIDSDEQDVIIKASKVLGLNAVDATKDELVLAQIERIRNNKKTQAAVPDSQGKATGAKKDVNYYISKGIVPEDEKMFDAFIEAQRAKDREGRITRR
jgi:tellurite resistance protein